MMSAPAGISEGEMILEPLNPELWRTLEVLTGSKVFATGNCEII